MEGGDPNEIIKAFGIRMTRVQVDEITQIKVWRYCFSSA